jgi:hypothetical protein
MCAMASFQARHSLLNTLEMERFLIAGSEIMKHIDHCYSMLVHHVRRSSAC